MHLILLSLIAIKSKANGMGSHERNLPIFLKLHRGMGKVTLHNSIRF